jgi:Flp pilus assembly protein TadD
VAVALGAVLAIYGVVNYVSHQGLRASQKAVPPTTAVAEKTAAPEVKRNSERVTIPEENTQPIVNEPSTDVELPQAEPRVQPKTEQILRKQIKTVWESGNYSEAMRLVDQVLSASPANSEARAWKKRIRAAQEAEAAIR